MSLQDPNGITFLDSYVFNVQQNHFNKVYRAKTPATQNPKFEYRNPKQTQDLNPNYEIRNGMVWNFLIFDHLKLFRISDFELRICSFVYTWRPLSECPFFNCRTPNSTKNLKYLRLDLRTLKKCGLSRQ
jgi:hypothetical protein